MDKDILAKRIRANVAHREDLIEHYGVKGMKWRDEADREKKYEVDADGNIVEKEQDNVEVGGGVKSLLDKIRLKMYGSKSKGKHHQDYPALNLRTRTTKYSGERSKISGVTNNLRYQATRAAADVTSTIDSKRGKRLKNDAKKNYIKGKIANSTNVRYSTSYKPHLVRTTK